jgi:hypothetical protein
VNEGCETNERRMIPIVASCRGDGLPPSIALAVTSNVRDGATCRVISTIPGRPVVRFRAISKSAPGPRTFAITRSA